MQTSDYFKIFDKSIKENYVVAEIAREKGLDPVSKVESPLAKSLAEKAVGLIASVYPQISNKNIIDRILELEKEYGKLDTAVAFKISEEVAKAKVLPIFKHSRSDRSRNKSWFCIYHFRCCIFSNRRVYWIEDTKN